jgi:hypothetical protein
MKCDRNHKNTAKEKNKKLLPGLSRLKKYFSPLAAKLIKSFCGGRLKNEGWKGRRVEGEKVRSLKMRLKASKPCVQANSNKLSNIRHFGAIAAGTVHLKKPSVGPKGLIGPPCHGAPLADGGKHE